MNEADRCRKFAVPLLRAAGWENFSLPAGPRAGCLPVLLLVAGWLALVAPLRADNPPTYVFQIDASAVPGSFYPSFLALDGSNNVYVVGNYDVVKFGRGGNFLTQWGSAGSNDGQFNNLSGIAVDGGNNVYVADSGNARVQKFDSNGNYLAQWGGYGAGNGQFQGPSGIAVDGSNNVYVTDSANGNNRVQKFTSSGNYVTQWGSFGAGNGQFNEPGSVAVDRSNNVYIVDQGNSRIEKFDGNGDYLTQWGSHGTNNGQFSVPYGVTVDRSNNVYVADFLNGRVQKFDGSGNYLTQWGANSIGSGQFILPGGVAVDSSGNSIYASDIGTELIDVFAYNTDIIPPVIVTQPTNQAAAVGTNVTFSVSVIGTAPFAYQWISNNVAVFGATNATFTLTNVYLSASGAYSVLVTNDFGSELKSNVVLTVWPAADFIAPTFVYEIDASAVPGGIGPSYVALDSSNNLLVSDGANDRVLKFAGNGTYLMQWGSSGTNNGQFHGPDGIAVDSSNNVYVVDQGNYRVEKFTSDGEYLTQLGGYGFGGDGQFGNPPQSVAVDGSNNVYVSEEDYGLIVKFDGKGSYLTQWGGTSGGLAVDGSNNVYVADNLDDRVEKFDSNGDLVMQWGSSGTNNGQFLAPEGVAVDSSGNVYVADSGNNRIEKFDRHGNYLTQWGGLGSGYLQLGGPVGIAVDSSGNVIYVADPGNNRIQIFVNYTSIFPPYIELQPTNQTDPTGTNVTLNIGVAGAGLSYQWNSNNVAVDGATNAAFILTNVSLSDSATYTALVSNSNGSVLSSNAVLTVLPAADFVQPTYLFEIDSSAVPGGFEPTFLALDTSNNVYVSDAENGRIVKFSRSGLYLTQWGSTGTSNGQFLGPEGVAVDWSNNVYVVDHSGRVQKFDSNGNYLTQWGSRGSGSGQFLNPLGVAAGRNNEVYVVDYAGVRVEEFDSNGDYLTQWGGYGSGNGQFTLPTDVAVDSSNNVYVADYSDRIQKFDSNGNYLTQWGAFGTNNDQFRSPEGTAVDSSNNVYVADTGNNRVEKFTSNGNYLSQWGSSGSGDGQFEGPVGIALESSGNFIYVVDYNNFRIEVFVNNTNVVPPIVTQQPTNQTVPAGFNVTFSAGVVGAAPFAYQWNFNDVAVPGATNATFTLTNVNLSASGNYSVLVTNSFGGELSGNAALTVLPTLVTTEPASGFSATGAMLNGSVTVGPDETVAWFEWGTGTNYGNIAGTTVVPGNDGSNNISATLSGLPGNFYHYRMDAANDFGIVYGEDQSFTVGFAPSATTLPPTNGANGATLEGAVNPEGWETTVYFLWKTPTLTNTTPGVNIGAGATSVNVSSFVPGLLSSTPYQYQAVASNELGTAVGNVVFGDPNQHHYFFSGLETNITLAPGTYIVTAYGAPGGWAYNPSYYGFAAPGSGAEMSAEFNFSTSTTLTLLVGGAGGTAVGGRDRYVDTNYYGGGGGGGSFVVEGTTPLLIAGGGGGGAVSGLQNPLFVDGGNGSTYTYGDAGSGLSDVGFNDLFGQSPTGGAGGTGGGGGDFYGGGSYGYGSGSGGGGSSFEDGGGGGIANSYGDDSDGDYSGGFGGGGAGYSNLGNSYYEFGFGGGGGGYSGGGGGGGASGSEYGTSATTIMTGSGGGGGSIIDSSAVTILAEVSGIYSPDGAGDGEIIITLVPPTPFAITTGAAFGFTNGVFGFDVSGPAGANVVVQVSTDLQTWIPLQTNLLGSGPLYFSDAQSSGNERRFYRVQLLR